MALHRGADVPASQKETIMSNGFEFFEGAATVSTTAPRITVRRTGQLVLTQAAVAMLGEAVSHVQLGFNEKTKAVGIRSVPEDAKGRYRLRSQPNGVSYLVDAKRFFAHHAVTLEKARGFAVEDFGGGVVGFRFEDGAAPSAEPPAAEKVERKAPAQRRKTSRS
jgi:hypothetical protein